MDQAVQSNAGHYMNKKTGDLVKTVENQGIPPHSNGNGVISKGKAKCTYKKTF